MRPPAGRQVASNVLMVLTTHSPYCRQRHLLPAPLLPGTLGQVDPLLAVGRQRPALTGPTCRRRQRAQVGVLAQTAEHHHAQGQHRLQEGSLGVAAIDDHPQLLAHAAQPEAQPTDQFDRQFQLGAKGPRVTLGQLGDVLGADVEQGTQRQCQGIPGRVANQPGQRDPDVAVDELLAGRSRRGVVMDAGPLHLGSVACGWGVVDGKEQVVAGKTTHQRLEDEPGADAEPGVGHDVRRPTGRCRRGGSRW